jgi:NADPH:quinone reductase-like Zn-dependent oxidoreductase
VRAIAVKSFRGTPQIMEVPTPEPKEGEVLLRLSAAGINPFDWKVVDGMLEGQVPHNFPLVLGFDGAGTVEKLGPGAKRFKTGDVVFTQAWQIPLGRGTYAPYVTVSEAAPIAKAPTNLSLVEAAVLPTSGMAALDLLDKLALGRSQTLLVIGATGGVGQFIVQLAKNRGLRVIATGTSSDVGTLKGLGAESVVDFTQGSLADQVRALHPHGVDGLTDLVSDAAGFVRCADLVKSGGAALTSNYVADEKGLGQRGIRGGNFALSASASLLEVLATNASAARLKVTIERQVPFDHAIETLSTMRTGQARGKSVIVI